MIRTFLPLDAISILFKTGSLSNKALTKDNIFRKDARYSTVANLLGQWMNPQVRKCLWVWSQGLDFRGLASARNRSSANAWEIDRLIFNDDDEECCISLLERLILAGCESGVEKIFLRLSVDNPLEKSIKKAGFRPYVTESLYGMKRGEVKPDAGVSSPTPRPKQIGDEYRLF